MKAMHSQQKVESSAYNRFYSFSTQPQSSSDRDLSVVICIPKIQYWRTKLDMFTRRLIAIGAKSAFPAEIGGQWQDCRQVGCVVRDMHSYMRLRRRILLHLQYCLKDSLCLSAMQESVDKQKEAVRITTMRDPGVLVPVLVNVMDEGGYDS